MRLNLNEQRAFYFLVLVANGLADGALKQALDQEMNDFLSLFGELFHVDKVMDLLQKKDTLEERVNNLLQWGQASSASAWFVERWKSANEQARRSQYTDGIIEENSSFNDNLAVGNEPSPLLGNPHTFPSDNTNRPTVDLETYIPKGVTPTPVPGPNQPVLVPVESPEVSTPSVATPETMPQNDHGTRPRYRPPLVTIPSERRGTTYNPDASTPETPTPPSFEAYPRMDLPLAMRSKETFSVTVGFQEKSSDGGALIRVQPTSEEDHLLVYLTGIGVDVLSKNMQFLKLSSEEEVTFECQARQEPGEASVEAIYLHKGQRVGSLRRTLIIVGKNDSNPFGGTLNVEPNVGEKEEESKGPLRRPDVDVDFTLNVTYKTKESCLEWLVTCSDSRIPNRGPVPLTISEHDVRSFPRALIKGMEGVGYRGPYAKNALDHMGQLIARYLPPFLEEDLRVFVETNRRVPTVLLYTNEPYIPWELAWIKKPWVKGSQPFLAAQVSMGRWLNNAAHHSPPVRLLMKRMTAVAAKYGRGTGLAELVEAPHEQETLVQKYGATSVEAKQEPMEGVNREKPTTEGHFLHFSGHGISNPEAGESELKLADSGGISDKALAGAYIAEQPPQFTFVFLNACQLGTAGETLSQAAGFPGALLHAGTLGFLAPLWFVHDVEARQLAETFYEQTLEIDMPVGEVLRKQRNTFPLELNNEEEKDPSTTCLAYIFYGHPALRITFESRNTRNREEES